MRHVAAGFKGQRMRWQDIQARFTKNGMGKPVVALVREGSGQFISIKGKMKAPMHSCTLAMASNMTPWLLRELQLCTAPWCMFL